MSDTALLTWKVQLARRNPARAISVLLLILICTYFVYFTLNDILLSLIAFLVLFLMVIPYYVPVTFILTDESIIRKMPFSKQVRFWNEFKRYDVDRNNIKLYTMSQSSRLDNYRSLLLICSKNAEDVLAIVREKIDPAAAGETPGV
ncbi:MAG: hypothetical protein JXR21_05925 [Candidatus Marinimicrobia bacterium]|nr:hypothetical protein [Candidatus Neomarinimicrobiota bacterium]